VGQNVPLPIDLAIGLYNSLYYRTSRDNDPSKKEHENEHHAHARLMAVLRG